MNAEFAAAAAQFIQRPKLSRKQIVTRLYRQSLKATFSWAANRDVFIMRAEELRAEFDRFKDYKPDHPCVRARPGRESPWGRGGRRRQLQSAFRGLPLCCADTQPL